MKAIDEVYRSNYLRAEDLPPRGSWFTIRDSEWVTFPDMNNKNVEKLVLSFEETSRQLVMNKTNAVTTAEELGTGHPDKWIGSGLLLRAEDVIFGGRTVKAIRVKDASKAAPVSTLKAAGPAAADPGQDDPGPTDEFFV